MAKVPIWENIMVVDNIIYITLRKHFQNLLSRRSRALMAVCFMGIAYYCHITALSLFTSSLQLVLMTGLDLSRSGRACSDPRGLPLHSIFKLHTNNVPLPSPVFLMATFFILKTDRWDVTKNYDVLLSQNKFSF